jgi:hypothetical protein
MNPIDQEGEAEQTRDDPPTATPPSHPHCLRPVANPIVITQAPLLAEASHSSSLGEGNPPPRHGNNDGNDDDDDVILSFLPKSGLSDPKTTASPPNPALVVAAVGQGMFPPNESPLL